MSATSIETLATEVAIDVHALPRAVAGVQALQDDIATEAALDRARTVLLRALADLFSALNQGEGRRTLRALLPGNIQPGGARVPGTSYELEPRAAATAIGTLVNGHTAESPLSPLRIDPLGAVLAVADFSDRKRAWRGTSPLTVRELLTVLIRAEQVRRALEQSPSLAMNEQHCFLGATTVASLTLLSGNAVQIGEAMHHVWHEAASTSMVPVACLHAEAVRRVFSADEPAAVTATRSWVASETFQAQPIPGCDSHERSAAVQRFEAAVQTRLPLKQCERIKAIVADPVVMERMAVHAFVAELVANQA